MSGVAEAVAAAEETPVELSGASDVRFYGISFEYATWLQPRTLTRRVAGFASNSRPRSRTGRTGDRTEYKLGLGPCHARLRHAGRALRRRDSRVNYAPEHVLRVNCVPEHV